MNQPLLKVSSITKTFPGLRALDGVGLEVHGGEVVAVVGQNGSGKSTFVKILAGVETADSGTVEARGPGTRSAETMTGTHDTAEDSPLVRAIP